VVLLGWPYLRFSIAAVATVLAIAVIVTPAPASLELLRYVAGILLIAIVGYLAYELRLANRNWELILCGLSDAIIIIDKGRGIRFTNLAAEGMTGWSSRETGGRKLEEIVKLTGDKRSEIPDLSMQNLLHEGTVFRTVNPLKINFRDGRQIWVEANGSPVRDRKGKVTGAILVLRDVTASREAQDHLNRSQRMEAVGRLASGVAGDFNDLLTVMTGFSEMLRKDLEPADHRRRFADEIFDAADRAAALARQLTTLGQKQPGPLKVQDLSTMIVSMETMLRRILGDRIELVIVPGTGKIRADASQIEQVIVNLAINSRDAMPQGGRFVIEIAGMDIDETQASKWPALRPGAYVTLSVSDTGTGMDAETREHLFEPFFTTKTNGAGSGLGLSVVYGIIQQSGGYINVYSQVEAGTIFEIFLPRHRGTSEIVLPTVFPRVKRGSETVLIADDDHAVRKLVYAILATNGYKVLEARDGVEALALYRTHQSKVSIVVTDVVMPKMSGPELRTRLLQMNPALKVLYMSGHQEADLGGESGSDEEERILTFLSKPFTPDVLLTKVRELLDRPASRAPHN
jgi:two-component system cell cycle sensor histidine kinase/response regulator CckA